MMRRAAGLFVLALALPAFSPASAYFQIWRTPPPPAIVHQQLTSLRDGGCGNPEFSVQKFGETAFMRGEISRGVLPPEFQRALAAATIAEDYPTATLILADYVASSDPVLASAANLHLAWVLLRTGTPSNSAWEEARRHLEKVEFEGVRADREYLEAAIAFHRSEYAAARGAAERALTLDPDYYNARILAAILDIKELDEGAFAGMSCERALTRTIEIVTPVLQLGACPVHIAHLDLSLRRYLGEPERQRSPEAAQIRSMILAFVSRNETLRRKLLGAYAGNPPQLRRCLDTVLASDFGRPGE